MPDRVGLWFAFLAGILLDVLLGTLFGQHTLALVIVVFMNIKSYQRVRVLALPQQAIYVFVLLLISQAVVTWIEGIMGRPPPLAAFFGSPVIGMLMWPWVFVMLRDIRRKTMLS